LYEVIDEASLSEQVLCFYERARRDPLLGSVFEQAITDWPPHIRTITDFWIQAMGGGARYAGNPFAKHQDKGIAPEMFDRWLSLWGETARELFAPAEAERLAQKAELIGRSLKSGLFFDPERRGPKSS
jgi:hemoglobin